MALRNSPGSSAESSGRASPAYLRYPRGSLWAEAGARVGERSASWTWHFDHPPADIWPLLADTARVNEAANIPKHAITEIPQPDGSVQFFGRVKIGPFDLKW